MPLRPFLGAAFFLLRKNAAAPEDDEQQHNSATTPTYIMVLSSPLIVIYYKVTKNLRLNFIIFPIPKDEFTHGNLVIACNKTTDFPINFSRDFSPCEILNRLVDLS